MTPTNILFPYTSRPALSMSESLLLSASPHCLSLSSLFYFLPSASYFPSQADERGWGQSAPVAMTPDSPCSVKARSFLCSISPELSTIKCVSVCDSIEREKRRRQDVCTSHVIYVKLQIVWIWSLQVVCNKIMRHLSNIFLSTLYRARKKMWYQLIVASEYFWKYFTFWPIYTLLHLHYISRLSLSLCAIYPKAGALMNNLAVDICSHLFLFSSPSVLFAMFFYAVLCHQTRSAAIGGRGVLYHWPGLDPLQHRASVSLRCSSWRIH